MLLDAGDTLWEETDGKLSQRKVYGIISLRHDACNPNPHSHHHLPLTCKLPKGTNMAFFTSHSC